MKRTECVELLDMLSCLKEISTVYLVPPEDVSKVYSTFSYTMSPI